MTHKMKAAVVEESGSPSAGVNTPWRPQGWQGMLMVMVNKTWFVEVAVAVCILAGAIVAFTLMAGHTLWTSLAPR